MTQPLILTFVSEDYIPVGRNWLRHVARLAPAAEVRIIALDRPTQAAFPADIVAYDPVPEVGSGSGSGPGSGPGSGEVEGVGGTKETGPLGALWVHRIEVIRAALESGRDVIHSDADAVWLRDPLPHFAACDSEMVFTQGTVWPSDVHKNHGLVLCCGLFYLASTPAVRGFVKDAARRVALDQDDQTSINRLIDANGVAWKIDAPYRIGFRKQEFLASRQVIRSDVATGPSVAVLPHHLFPRMMDKLAPDTVVAHPLSPKDNAAKIAALSRLGLWDEA